MADQKMREGDTLTLEAKVVRVSDDEREVTIEVWGQRITREVQFAKYLIHHKGPKWRR